MLSNNRDCQLLEFDGTHGLRIAFGAHLAHFSRSRTLRDKTLGV